MKTQISRRKVIGGLAVALMAASTSLLPSFTETVLAHEAPCPYCSQKITQDTDQQDNETVLKYGRKRIEYKCVYCALVDSKTAYKGDLTILAPSEKKGQPVTLRRTGGKWSSTTEGAAFVAQKANHKVCHVTYRAFSSQSAAQAYIAERKAQLPDAKPLTLAGLLEIVDKAKS